jgi:hypothetical protein
MADQREPAESREPIEYADPTENMDRKEPTEPIDRAEPTEPIERTDPLDPIDNSESSDHRDHFEPEPFDLVMAPIMRYPARHGWLFAATGRLSEPGLNATQITLVILMAPQGSETGCADHFAEGLVLLAADLE